MIRNAALLLLAVPLVGLAVPRIAVVGDSLGDAKARYAAATDVPRDDCDPVSGGRWVCASFNDPVLADVGETEPAGPASPSAPAPAPTAPTPAPVPNAPTAPQPAQPPSIGIAVIGSDLNDAKRRYARATSQRRLDCDPASGGRWICASFQNPVLADVGEARPSAPAPAPRPDPVRPTPPPPASGGTTVRVQAENLPLGNGWSIESQRSGFEGSGYAIWRGADLFGQPGSGATRIAFDLPRAGEYQLVIRARAVDPARPDLSNDTFFRLPGTPWTKVFTTGRDSWQVGGTGDRADRKFPFRANFPAGPVEIEMSGRSTRHAIDWVELKFVGAGSGAGSDSRSGQSGVPSATLGQNDLLALHYDSAPDPDDLMAMIAARLILDDYPNIDPIVVNGAIGDKVPRSAFITGSTEHVRTMFPAALDYFSDKANTVQRSATAWQSTLEAGGTVHVAAGGPMDLSADILRELESRGVSNLKRIRVVQHSHGRGFNEDRTSDAGMAFIRSRATYVTIDNGNAGGNRTPDFNEVSADIMDRALRSQYGQQWARARAAFATRGSNKLDFSDTVELMHILGLPKSHAPTVRAFADRYFTG